MSTGGFLAFLVLAIVFPIVGLSIVEAGQRGAELKERADDWCKRASSRQCVEVRSCGGYGTCEVVMKAGAGARVYTMNCGTTGVCAWP